jgi:hypothetical protein
MLLSYIIVSTLLNVFLCFVWNTKTLLNVFLKMVFFAIAVWGLVLFLGHVAPLINDGTLRLL